MPMNEHRAYVSGKFAFELDGIAAGWVQSAEGGMATAEIVQEKLGQDAFSRKHISGIKYDDITFKCGTGMSRNFWAWMERSIGHDYQRKDGAIIAANYDFKEVSRLDFHEALVTEMSLPALDAGSKEQAAITVKISPEWTKYRRSKGAPGPSIAGGYPIDQRKQKEWFTANFRIRIDGLDEACSRVNKIEGLTIKQKVTENPSGLDRTFEREPATIEYPNLVMTLPESHAEQVYQWYDSFVLEGQNTEQDERNGTLEYLSADLKHTIFTVQFTHLGIFKVTPDKVESGSENLRRVKVEMYCEQMKFDYLKAPVWD